MKKPMSSNSQITEIGRKRIDRLFLSFSAIYGQMWRSQFKSDEFLSFTKNEWAQALQDIDDKHFNEALKHCQQAKEFKYPPSLPQFIDICHAAERRNRFFQGEVTKIAPPEVAHFYLKKIKAILNT